MNGAARSRTAVRSGPRNVRLGDIRLRNVLLGWVVLGGVLLGGVLLGTTGCSTPPDQDLSAGLARGHLVGDAATRTTPPATEAATGSLVEGFPSTVVPLPPGATVTASAVQRRAGLLDVSLSATTPAPAPEVLDFYAKALAKAGFSRTRGSVLPLGAVGLAFSRDGGRQVLLVAVADQGALRSFSVGGTVVDRT